MTKRARAAPGNLRRAVLLNWKLCPDVAARIDALMGEGFARALAGRKGSQPASSRKAATVWGKGVDVPFRRSSFLYEARRPGYWTPEQLERLLIDARHYDELIEVTKRANCAIIDYARLGRREREIVRRVVFFYSWLKGSTLYAGHFLAEHPA